MFINFSNHPCASWSREQREAAEVYGDIMDIAFPEVSPYSDSVQIATLASEYFQMILEHSPKAVLVQGEMSLSFAVSELLIRKGIPALCACSERDCVTTVAEDGSTVRRSVFRFVRFRQYTSINM